MPTVTGYTVAAIDAFFAAINADLTSRPKGKVAYAQKTTSQTSITTVVDVSGLSVTWAATASRRYRTTVVLECTTTVAADLLIAYISDGSNVVKTRDVKNAPSGPTGAAYFTLTPSIVETGLSGSITRKVRAERNVGTGTFNINGASASPAYILVEDIGPA